MKIDKVVSIDPGYGKRSYYAILDFKTEKLIKVGAIPESEKEAFNFFSQFEGVKCAVVIEKEYIGINPASSLKLATVRGWLSFPAKFHGVPVETVSGVQWQTAVLGKNIKRSKDRDRFLLSLTGAVFPEIGGALNIDIASAVQIGLYWIRNEKKKGFSGGKNRRKK